MAHSNDTEIIDTKLATIAEKFCINGALCQCATVTVGNINSTYCCTFEAYGEKKKYVFQKINTYVFKQPVLIMENIERVTSHISSKCDGSAVLRFHHTADGKNYVFDDDGGFWRVMDYVDAVTFDTCDDLKVIENTGRAFGEFQVRLADLDGSVLNETIPDFHNTVKRLETLFSHVKEDPVGRVEECRREIEWIASVKEKASELWLRCESGEFPVRVTHNDTKSNNVLFDRNTLEPLVVVDLDTVMPGMAMYDFGDAVRFIANTAAEDEADLSKVSVDFEKYGAFCRGFIGAAGGTLTPAEVGAMTLGAFSVTVELASRFLDDYLTGDAYFKTKYEGHNLVRARCQICLAKDILAKFDRLQKIAEDSAK